MSAFSVHFDTDNAAFEDVSGPGEVARILCEVAQKVVVGHRSTGSVLDINGNVVGQFDWIKP